MQLKPIGLPGILDGYRGYGKGPRANLFTFYSNENLMSSRVSPIVAQKEIILLSKVNEFSGQIY
jgi:hypothetical protein